MKGNRSVGTKPERVLARLLRRKLTVSRLPGRPDFVYPKTKVAVFVNGCFWHSCAKCKIKRPSTNEKYWRKKLDRNVERDKLVRIQLRDMGWRVVTVWEHQVAANPTRVARRIISLRKVNGATAVTRRKQELFNGK